MGIGDLLKLVVDRVGNCPVVMVTVMVAKLGAIVAKTGVVQQGTTGTWRLEIRNTINLDILE